MNRHQILIFFVNFIVLSSAINDEIDLESEVESEISINDILNADFMPGALLTIDRNSASLLRQNFTKKTLSDNKTLVMQEGTFTDAFITMDYHRKMMNEYLCRNFIAEEILTELTTPADEIEEMSRLKFSRRFGDGIKDPASSKESNERKSEEKPESSAALRDVLLSDPGSSNYKDWLSKTTTLEDIYQHYGISPTKRSDQDFDFPDHPREDFDGDVTGYAVQQEAAAPVGVPTLTNGGNTGKIGGVSGYGNIGYHSASGYAGPPSYSEPDHIGTGYEVVHHPPPPIVHYRHGGGGHGKKDVILKHLFDIALTALAFLSFGIFAIQVILCLASTKVTTTSTTTTAGTATATGLAVNSGSFAEPGYGIITESFPGHFHYPRNRRTAEYSDHVTPNAYINELARRVLVSLEAAYVGKFDNGNCLRREICDNNKYSRTMTDNQKIWIPVYGLGLCWLSGRIGTNMPPATAMMESLKAAALGLGNADCYAIYRKCDIRSLQDARRRRKRRK